MKKFFLIAFVLIFLIAACAGEAPPQDMPTETATTEKKITATPSSVPPTAEPTAEPTEVVQGETLTEPDVIALLSTDQLDLKSLSANADQETFGPILTMQLVNQSDGELIVELPCGLIFVPDNGDEQPLIVVEQQTIAIPLGESAEITPYVVCADIGAGAPSLAATYSLGTITEDLKMLQLADCICDKGFDTSLYSEEGMQVQFAMWYVQMGGDPAGYISTYADQLADGSLDEFYGSDEDMDNMMELFENNLGDWLEICQIEFET